MIKENAAQYFQLGQEIDNARLIYSLDENFTVTNVALGERKLNKRGEDDLRGELQKLLRLAQKLGFPVSTALLGRYLRYLPQTGEEFDVLVQAFKVELDTKLFLMIPQHLAAYYERDDLVSDRVIKAFPKASEEIRTAGTALAAGLNTACVFHAMRGAEIGVRALGAALNIQLAKPIELAEWQEILNGITPKIRDIENLPNSTPNKDADLHFFSEVAAQFRFFKNGWRIRVAHARATYTEPQAKEAIDHVRSFFETLATRLAE